MPCFSPLQGLRLGIKPNGKADIKIFKTRFKNHSVLHPEVDVLIPCGQCVGCRLERSRQWAVRCLHEASMFENNCFITLTFNDENLFKRPRPMSLDKDEFPLFMKRLREQFVPKCPFPKSDKTLSDLRKQWFFDNGIRVYYCGEYGDRFNRPHYHACLFNFTFPDLLFWKEVNGFRLYTSEILSRLWPYGYVSVGSVTFESAAYVARYIMKKVNGKDSQEFYRFIDFDSGETYVRVPEFTNMSRNGGIGISWFEKWGMVDTYPNDYVVVRNRKMRPPKFYDSKLPEDMLSELKANRIAKALEFVDDQTPERLVDRCKVASAKLALFSRNVE